MQARTGGTGKAKEHLWVVSLSERHLAPSRGMARPRRKSSSPRIDDARAGCLRTSIPAHLAATLREWGPTLRDRVARARSQWLQDHGLSRSLGGLSHAFHPTCLWAVGTDCSGAEAPIWSLRAMGIPHRHVFSCDASARVRKYIRLACPPAGPVYEDMVSRDHRAMPAHNIYVCGFPCTPFSTLRHKSGFLKEAAAKPFWAMLQTLAAQLPALGVLENVMGIRRVMSQLKRALARLRVYHAVALPVNPTDYGEPVARPRFYILLLRCDVCLVNDRRSLLGFVEHLSGAPRETNTAHIADRMLLRRAEELRTRPVQTVSAENTARSQTWVAKHTALGAPVHTALPCPRSLTTERERCIWAFAVAKYPGADLVVDVSQAVDRLHLSTSGQCPCVMPGSKIIVAKVGRMMLPIEKLLVHLFPVHEMHIPASLGGGDIARLGGNTMHLKAVGLALLIGSSCIDWSKAEARPGARPAGAAGEQRGLVLLDEPRAGQSPAKRKRSSRRGIARGSRAESGLRTHPLNRRLACPPAGQQSTPQRRRFE